MPAITAYGPSHVLARNTQPSTCKCIWCTGTGGTGAGDGGQPSSLSITPHSRGRDSSEGTHGVVICFRISHSTSNANATVNCRSTQACRCRSYMRQGPTKDSGSGIHIYMCTPHPYQLSVPAITANGPSHVLARKWEDSRWSRYSQLLGAPTHPVFPLLSIRTPGSQRMRRT